VLLELSTGFLGGYFPQLAYLHDLQTFIFIFFIFVKTDTYGVFAKLMRCGTAIALIYNQ
jgi:hypothetical protein